jgi:hypothetical protein
MLDSDSSQVIAARTKFDCFYFGLYESFYRAIGRGEVTSGNVDSGKVISTSKQVNVVCEEPRCASEKEKLPSVTAEGTGNLGNFELENLVCSLLYT